MISLISLLAAAVMWRTGIPVVQLLPDPLKKVSTEVQTEEKNSQEQHEESMIESLESRADKEMATTALNDSKATLESSITDNELEFLSAQSCAAEEKNSQE